MTDWASYKAKQREARKEAGLKRVEVWAHPDDAEAIKNVAEMLRWRRSNAGKVLADIEEWERSQAEEMGALLVRAKKLRKETR